MLSEVLLSLSFIIQITEEDVDVDEVLAEDTPVVFFYFYFNVESIFIEKININLLHFFKQTTD